MKYDITRDFINVGSSRSGQKLKDVKFIVSHDTGNPGASAYANRNYFENTDPNASAHTFIDDKNILEIIPLDEKAWHVRYGKQTDDQMYGDDANDVAIGVELAYGGTINFLEAYERYVWYHAYLAHKYNLNPLEDIVAHSTLDPSRRSDPQNALNQNGISWNEFICDVNRSYKKYFKEGETILEPVVKGVSVQLPLSIGDYGEFVKEIQGDLIKAGFPLSFYGADGKYGEETERAVMRFQKKYGVKVDGLLGTQTLNTLKEVVRSSKAIHVFPLPKGILQRGDEGEKVKQVQRALKQLKFNPESIDGIYGSNTEDAVRRFQSMYVELKKDGIYGRNTRRFIGMELEQLNG